jgi:N-acetyl-anhydromuramyl-L-alanine amidase AmpD
MTEQEWISKVAPDALEVGVSYGIKPSVLIGMSCQETGYGSSSGLVKYNNVLGMKATLTSDWVWNGEVAKYGTFEVYKGRGMVNLDDYFRVYGSIRECFEDFCGFMTRTKKYGPCIKMLPTAAEQLEALHNLGYSTDPAYVQGVLGIINKFDLTRYDMAISINKNPSFTTGHNTSRRTGAISYIVIHYVGATGDAKANVNYYNTYNRASCDFYVGFAGDIWQYNTDPANWYSWEVGGDQRAGHKGGKLYGVAKNSNCIGIEMCVRNSGDLTPNSRAWHFEQATILSTVKLTQYLMQVYGIPLGHVIRHYDVNGKLCPGVYGWNADSGSEDAWTNFKAMVAGTATQVVGSADAFTLSNTNKALTAAEVKDIQTQLISLGISCGSSGADGKFGEDTWKAVKVFQTWYEPLYHLAVDGDCGPKTREALAECSTARLADIFSIDFYRGRYTDLQKAYPTDNAQLIRHFIIYGMAEGRQGSSTFNPAAYKSRYADLQKAFGTNWRLYYWHWIQHGKKEGRKAV